MPPLLSPHALGCGKAPPCFTQRHRNCSAPGFNKGTFHQLWIWSANKHLSQTYTGFLVDTVSFRRVLHMLMHSSVWCPISSLVHNAGRSFGKRLTLGITPTHIWMSMEGLCAACCRGRNFAPLSRGFEATIATAIGGGGLASAFKPPRLRLRQGPPLLDRKTPSCSAPSLNKVTFHPMVYMQCT